MNKKLIGSESPDFLYCSLKGKIVSFPECREAVENNACRFNFECKFCWDIWDELNPELDKPV